MDRKLLLEDGSGGFLLEDGSGFLVPEDAAPVVVGRGGGRRAPMRTMPDIDADEAYLLALGVL